MSAEARFYRTGALFIKNILSKGEETMAYLMNYKQYQKYNASGIYSISVIYTKPNEGTVGRKVVYIG